MDTKDKVIAHLQKRVADAHAALNTALELRQQCELARTESCSDCDEEVMFATLDLHQATAEQERLLAVVG
jgi:hypothetical protein